MKIKMRDTCAMNLKTDLTIQIQDSINKYGLLKDRLTLVSEIGYELTMRRILRNVIANIQPIKHILK